MAHFPRWAAPTPVIARRSSPESGEFSQQRACAKGLQVNARPARMLPGADSAPTALIRPLEVCRLAQMEGAPIDHLFGNLHGSLLRFPPVFEALRDNRLRRPKPS